MIVGDSMIGAMVEELRENAQMSGATLGKEMSAKGFAWHQSTACKVESGTRSLKAAELFAIADIFGVTLADLHPDRAVKRRVAILQARIDTMLRDIDRDLMQ